MKSLQRVRKRRGRCFELAGRAMLHEDEAETFMLIHGLIHGQVDCPKITARRVEHAWIELDGGETIHDPQLNECMPRGRYMQRFGAIEKRRYTRKQAAKFMIETGHWGPWR